MTDFARLKDCFLRDRDAERALFCTYGFEPGYFEAEIFPALFPSLANDRKSGSKSAYLFKADSLLSRREVVVLYDHTDAGKTLPYDAIRIRPGGRAARRAFHPKLTLVDYGDLMRVVVSSANLGRPGWSAQLELFVFEDLLIGKSHGWARPLRFFLEEVRALASDDAYRARLDPFLARLRQVRRTKEAHLASSFDAELLEELIRIAGDVERVDVVSPFFEGAEGVGVFDAVVQRFPRARGRLFLDARLGDRGKVEVEAPEQKIRSLASSSNWTLHQVRSSWLGDEDDAPPRRLHAKLIGLSGRTTGVMMVGSANFTRGALTRTVANGGNVELAAFLIVSPRRLAALLPQHEPLDIESVTFIEREEASPDEIEGLERWVEAALYRCETSQVELHLRAGAPPLSVRYEGREFASDVRGPVWAQTLDLGEPMEVQIAAEHETATVPLLILDPALWIPRGKAAEPSFDEYLELLAGSRDPVAPGDGLSVTPSRGREGSELLIGGGGAIAWRKLLRAVKGISRELIAEAPFPRGVSYRLDNDYGVAGLLRRVSDLHASGRFLTADYAFALHEVRRMLRDVGKNVSEHPTSAGLVKRSERELAREFQSIRRHARGKLKRQLDLLASELA